MTARSTRPRGPTSRSPAWSKRIAVRPAARGRGGGARPCRSTCGSRRRRCPVSEPPRRSARGPPRRGPRAAPFSRSTPRRDPAGLSPLRRTSRRRPAPRAVLRLPLPRTSTAPCAQYPPATSRGARRVGSARPGLGRTRSVRAERGERRTREHGAGRSRTRRPRLVPTSSRGGDSLGRIAKRELGDAGAVDRIASLNGIAKPYTIYAGRTLLLPVGDGGAATHSSAQTSPAQISPAQISPRTDLSRPGRPRTGVSRGGRSTDLHRSCGRLLPERRPRASVRYLQALPSPREDLEPWPQPQPDPGGDADRPAPGR